MALKSTIYKASLQVSDVDRGYYHAHSLTIALHPSETEERMMLRLLMYALYASPNLVLGKGISTDDEPDLWEKRDNGDIDLWIDLGQPDEKRVRRAAGKSRRVVILSYGGATAEHWWKKHGNKFQRFNNLKVLNAPVDLSAQLAALAERNMELQCMISDGVWFGNESENIEISLGHWKDASGVSDLNQGLVNAGG